MSDRQLIADLLSALEYHTEQTRPIEFSRVAIEAAREYLRKPAHQQEPVAWVLVDGELSYPNEIDWETLQEQGHEVELLYTSPPASKPLTDDEIKLVMDGRGEEGDDDYVKPAFDPFGISEDDLMNFARAIEAAHGITGEQK